jgi:4-hydroxy-3-polyprenylbenzoate decarboxylase
VLISIKKQYPYHAARLAHGLWGSGQMSFSKVICVLDEDIDVQNLGQVAWRLLANLDPKRDFAFVDGPIDQLDHGANQALWGSKVCIDGTRKWREEGYAREWPEPCRMSAEVEARVDAMWAELGIGGARANGSIANGAPGARPGHAHRGAGEGASAMARVLDVARELLARGRS